MKLQPLIYLTTQRHNPARLIARKRLAKGSAMSASRQKNIFTRTSVFTLVTGMILLIAAISTARLPILEPFTADVSIFLLLLSLALILFSITRRLVLLISIACLCIVTLGLGVLVSTYILYAFFITASYFTLAYVLAIALDELILSKIITSARIIMYAKWLQNFWRNNKYSQFLTKIVKHDSNELKQIFAYTNQSLHGLFTNEKTFSNKRFFVYSFLIFLLASSIIYLRLVFSYFIQDEWYYFGLFNQFVDEPFGFVKIFIQQLTNPKLYGIHFTPLWNALFFIEYQLFRLDYSFYIVASILLHSITTILVAMLSLKLTKSRIISFLAGLFFAITFAHAEAVFWVNTHIQTQVATMAALGAIFFWLTALQTKRHIWFGLAVALSLIGLLIKETVFALFPLLFFTTLIYGRRDVIRRSIAWLIIGALVYMPYRIVFAELASMRDTSLTVGPIIPVGIFDIGPQTFRLLFYPFKALIQEFINPDIIIGLAEILVVWNYPAYAKEREGRGSDFLTFIQSAGSDMIMILLGILFSLLLWLLFKRLSRSKDSTHLKAFLFACAVVMSSIIPLLFIAGWLSSLFAFVTFIDSRHLYFTSIGASLLFAIAMVSIDSAVDRIWPQRVNRILSFKGSKVSKLLALLCAVVVLVGVGYQNYRIISKVYMVGNERRNIVLTIVKAYPSIHDKSLFFIKSNKPYYGLAENVLPFQTNFGYTLLHQYRASVGYPTAFFMSNFLLEKGIAGEGYREQNDKGFGYVFSEKSLLQFVKQYSLQPAQVYAFTYDGNTKITTNITEATRLKLKGLLQEEQALATWQKFEDENLLFNFRYPGGYRIIEENSQDKDRVLRFIRIQTPQTQDIVHLKIFTKPDTIGVRGFIADFTTVRGEHLGYLHDQNITIGPFDVWPAVVYEDNYEKSFFFNTKSNLQLKQVTFIKNSVSEAFPLDTFLRHLEYDI